MPALRHLRFLIAGLFIACAVETVADELPKAVAGMDNSPAPPAIVNFGGGKKGAWITYVALPGDAVEEVQPIVRFDLEGDAVIPSGATGFTNVVRKGDIGEVRQQLFLTKKNRFVYFVRGGTIDALALTGGQPFDDLFGALPKTTEGPQREIPLPSQVAQAVLCGRGRYLLLHLAEARQAAVLDLRSGKILKSVPVESPQVILVGGATRFVIVDCTTHRLLRYAYSAEDTNRLDVPIDMTNKKRIFGATLGTASEGPLVLSFQYEDNGLYPTFASPFNLETLLPADYRLDWRLALGDTTPLYEDAVDKALTASADGCTIHTVRTVLFRATFADGVAVVEKVDVPQPLLRSSGSNYFTRPSTDGAYVYNDKILQEVGRDEWQAERSKSGEFAPCSDPRYWMTVTEQAVAQKSALQINFYRAEPSQRRKYIAIVRLQPIDAIPAAPSTVPKKPADERIFYSIEERKLVVIPQERSVVVLKALNLNAKAAELPLSTTPDPASFRTWTSRGGEFTVEARLLNVVSSAPVRSAPNYIVKLEKVDGARIEIALDNLSPTDQQHLRSQLPLNTPKTPPERNPPSGLKK